MNFCEVSCCILIAFLIPYSCIQRIRSGANQNQVTATINLIKSNRKRSMTNFEVRREGKCLIR